MKSASILKNPRFWIGIAISLLCLALAFKGIQLSSLAEALSRANYSWIIPSVILVIAEKYFRAIRWGILFYPRKNLTINKLFAVLSIGYFFNMVLPARLGDIARAYLISDGEDIPLAHSLSTIVVERLLDLATVLVLLIALLAFIPIPEWVMQTGLLMGFGLFVGLILLIVLLWQKERSLTWLYQILKRVPKINYEKWISQAGKFIDGLEMLHHSGPLMVSIAWSLGLWLTSGASLYVLMQGFPIHQPFSTALLILCAVGLSVVVPTSPGYIGVFHAAVVFILSILGVNKEIALSYAIVLHGLGFITLVMLGIIFAIIESVSIGEIKDIKLIE